MSLAQKGVLKTEETIAKMRAAQGTSVFLYDSSGSLVNTFSSIREAGKLFKCSPSTIQRYAFNNKLFKDKWTLSFLIPVFKE